MSTTQRFVYVAQLRTGDEVGLRRVLEHLPQEAFAQSEISEFATFVGSGYCVFEFTVPEGDFQEQYAGFANHPRIQEFFQAVAGYLVEGEQIARTFTAGESRSHHVDRDSSQYEGTVTSAELPLAVQVSRWPTERA